MDRVAIAGFRVPLVQFFVISLDRQSNFWAFPTPADSSANLSFHRGAGDCILADHGTSIRSQRSVSRTATTSSRVNRILQTKSDVSRLPDARY
jgi:hypothetical protein